MATDWSGRRTVGVMLAVTVGCFTIGMFALLVLWACIRLLGFAPSFWAMTEATATAVTAATVLGGAILAYRELSEISATRHMEVADRLFEELNDPPNVEARRRIFQHLPGNPETEIARLSDADHAAIKQVLNSLDRVAFITQAGWIPEDMIMPWMSPMILKSWVKLQPWVEYESSRRKEPEYYRQVRTLADRCLAWCNQHGMSTEVTWVEHAL